ncbi:hypothetical protein HMN09_01194700 [Mycena chlorophos]|uniref:Uncharacterized protein n=1 Tax=Mycena chlorophos TaxID=658473 RepID=A0A8H6S693_MYCCL|nr:hypothetical protein HMN09_01194700 [Mycena chlorophos]
MPSTGAVPARALLFGDGIQPSIRAAVQCSATSVAMAVVLRIPPPIPALTHIMRAGPKLDCIPSAASTSSRMALTTPISPLVDWAILDQFPVVPEPERVEFPSSPPLMSARLASTSSSSFFSHRFATSAEPPSSALPTTHHFPPGLTVRIAPSSPISPSLPSGQSPVCAVAGPRQSSSRRYESLVMPAPNTAMALTFARPPAASISSPGPGARSPGPIRPLPAVPVPVPLSAKLLDPEDQYTPVASGSGSGSRSGSVTPTGPRRRLPKPPPIAIGRARV